MAARFRRLLLGLLIFLLISFQILRLTLYLVAYQSSLERNLALFLSLFQFLLILKYLVKKHHESASKFRTKIGSVLTIKKYEIPPPHVPQPQKQLRRKFCQQALLTGLSCLILTTFVILCLVYPLSYENECNLYLSLKAVFRSDGLSSYEGWSVLLLLETCIAGAAIAILKLTYLISKLLRNFTKKNAPQKIQPSKIKTASLKESPLRKMPSQLEQTSDQTISDGHSLSTHKKQSSSVSLITMKRKQVEKLFKIPELSEKEEQNTNYTKSKRLHYSQTLNPNITFFSNCFLCLRRFTSQDVIYKVKGCSHHFHLQCIYAWDRKFLPMRDFCPECLQKRKN